MNIYRELFCRGILEREMTQPIKYTPWFWGSLRLLVVKKCFILEGSLYNNLIVTRWTQKVLVQFHCLLSSFCQTYSRCILVKSLFTYKFLIYFFVWRLWHTWFSLKCMIPVEKKYVRNNIFDQPVGLRMSPLIDLHYMILVKIMFLFQEDGAVASPDIGDMSPEGPQPPMILLQQLLTAATQPSPVKAIFDKQELEVSLCFPLISNVIK